MNAKFLLSRTAALVAGTILALAGTARAAETDALPSFDDNYVKVSGVLPSVSGSHAAFQRRTQFLHEGAGGIEALSYGYDFSKETNLHIDGRALPGAEDYLAQFKLAKNEVGSFEAGYKRTRTFYDGLGGFFPTNNVWLPIYQRSRYVDRGKFFVNGTVALPKAPVFSFRYTNELRNGIKDSTIWGDSDLTGIPIWSLSSLNPVTSARKILPAYIQLGDRQETWEVSVRHTVGSTTGTVSLIGTRINNLDSRSVDRYTGELKPYPAIPSNPPTLVPNALGNNPNQGFDIQGMKENALTYLGKLETKLSERATAYAETSYRHATGDTTGSRLISVSTATAAGVKTAVGAYTVGGRPAYSYTSAGTVKTDVLTGVLGLRLDATKTLAVDVALRGEDSKFTGRSDANYVSNLLVLATGTVTPVPVAGSNSSKIREKPWTPAVDVRYTGLRTLALYGSWDYRTLKQDERTNYAGFTANTTNGTLSAPLAIATSDVKEKHSNLKLGANWTPSRFFNLRPEFFTKDHENRFEGYGVSAGNFYILDYDIYGARVTAILRPLPTVTLNTRYVLQRGKASIVDELYARGDANDSRHTQLCETIDWAPSKLFYVQGSVNLVYDTISTSYPRVAGAAKDVLHNADNNYWDGSIVAVFVVDKETDAQIQSTYYKADNYEPALAARTLPYGATGREYTVTVGVKHKFNDRMVGSAKLGYFNSTNETTGGFANFKGPVGYLSLDYRL